MTNTPEQSQLGKPSAYIDHYDASLLFPIPRAGKRLEIGIAGSPSFFGADLWTAFELSWLNPRGKPQVAIAHITVPCDSINIIESKRAVTEFQTRVLQTEFVVRESSLAAHKKEATS